MLAGGVAWAGYRHLGSGGLTTWVGNGMYLTALYFCGFGFVDGLGTHAGFVQSVAAIFLISTTLWEVSSTAVAGFLSADDVEPEDSGSDSPAPRREGAPSGGIDIDLDESTAYSAENWRKTTEAISAVIGIDLSDLKRLKGLDALLTIGEPSLEADSEPEIDKLSGLLGLR